MGLRDIGGGFQVIDPTKIGGNSSESQLAKEQLSLADMVNRLRNAPLERRRLEAQTLQAENEAKNIPIQNELLVLQRLREINTENRAQNAFFAEQVSKWATLAKERPELAVQLAPEFFPNIRATLNQDGTITAALLNQDQTGAIQIDRTFQLDPNQIASPEKRLEIQKSFRDELKQATQEFSEIANQMKNIDRLAELATGFGDLGLIFAYNKQLDPGGRITEGEVMTAQNAPALSEKLRNLYNKALSEGGPIFGPKGNDPARRQLVEAARVLFESQRDTYFQRVQSTHKIAGNAGGINADDIVVEVGGFTRDQILGREPLGDATQAPAQNAPTTIPKKPSLDDILQNNLLGGE